MPEDDLPFDERRFEQLFDQGSTPIPDKGFSVAVMTRVRGRIRIRRMVLFCAAVLGGVIAVLPATNLLFTVLQSLEVLASGLAEISGNWWAIPWLPALAMALLAPLLVRSLEA